MSRPHNGDYTRAEKIAMTVAALGIDFDVQRIAERKSQGLPSSPTISLARPQRPQRPQRPKAPNKSSAPTPARNQTTRAKAGTTLWLVTWCAYCCRFGSVLKDPDGRLWHLDHVMPLSKGGRDCPSNIVKACAKCNMAKGTKLWQVAKGTPVGDGTEWGRSEDADDE